MPKLLIINTSIAVTSVGRIADLLGRLAAEVGWDVTFAHGHRYAGETTLRTLPVGSLYNEYLHALHSLIADGHGLASRGATRELIRNIEELKPDVVHLHNIHGYYLNYPMLAEWLAKSGIPVVWTLHDQWPMTGHCAFSDCDGWLTGCQECHHGGSYPRTIISQSARNFRIKTEAFSKLPKVTYVGISRWITDMGRRSLLADNSNAAFMTIHNGIDTGAFAPTASDLRQRFGIGDKCLVMGCASPFNSRKGFSDFIKLRRALPADSYAVAMVGVSASQRKKLAGEGIIGISYIANPDELAQWYSTADVFFNPSYGDNMCSTLLEAQSCGTPVVTYDTGGCPEAVSDRTGRVIARGDIDAAVNAIQTLSAANSDDCRSHIVSNFDSALSASNYLKLYLTLLG